MYGLIIIISGKKGIMRLLVDPSHVLVSLSFWEIARRMGNVNDRQGNGQASEPFDRAEEGRGLVGHRSHAQAPPERSRQVLRRRSWAAFAWPMGSKEAEPSERRRCQGDQDHSQARPERLHQRTARWLFEIGLRGRVRRQVRRESVSGGDDRADSH